MAPQWNGLKPKLLPQPSQLRQVAVNTAQARRVESSGNLNRKPRGDGVLAKQTRLLIFLFINTTLMLVEFGYGAANNNLGLLSDGCHMLFDNASLIIGLYAARMAMLPADRVFTFGYGRIESLAGFANGVLLVFVALEITLESVERIMEPPAALSTDGLLVVSVVGLLVNLVGLLCCHEAHEMGHHHCDGDDDSSDGGGQDVCDNTDHNMRAVFLHILADTLGSVSVIVSVLCIKYLGWNWADPLASLFISITTLASVLPLIQQTSEVLLLHRPATKGAALAGCAHRVERLPGALAVGRARFWNTVPGELCGTVLLCSQPGADRHALSRAARAVYERVRHSHLAVEVREVRQQPGGGLQVGGGVLHSRSAAVLSIRAAG
eukprot:CAMPEP_0117664540 /NCGR_PEP_ID=MMETSP0804-20121206/9283_1 /TAXON_ID=1074897 /ORGANISM="Tetraselmis astigmatica, Strain CCMP880" /LENGTH=378 /DNA_ID=CAMNT_0005471797 /DNA_START=642 /DNA_END=1778 /DNA_ORIENTATION=+